MTEPNRRIYALRVNRDTPALTDAIAQEFGCYRLTPHATIEGSTGILLDKIAQGSLKVVRTN